MYAHDFPPMLMAGVHRILRFVKYLPEFGWESVVISAPSRHGTVSLDETLLKQVPQATVIERPAAFNPETELGKLLRRRKGHVPSAAAPGSSFAAAMATAASAPSPRTWHDWLRQLREFLFRTPDEYVWWVGPAVRAGLRAIEQTNPAAVYTTGPPHSTHLAGLLTHQITGLPWIADFRDPWSRQPWGQKRNFWGARLLPFIESECVRGASCVILNTGRMADEFRRHYRQIRSSKFVALPNGFDPELTAVVDDCLRELHVPASAAPLTLCHPGTLYHKRDIRPLIDAVRLLADQGLPVRFVNIGDCPYQQEFEAYIAEAGLRGSIEFEKPVPHREILRRMAASDVLVVIQPNNDLQVPGKLYEMMLYGKPVLALADDGEVSDLVDRYELGESARSDDAAEIARVVHRLAERARSGVRPSPNPAALQAFDGRLLAARLAEKLSEVVRDFGRDEAVAAGPARQTANPPEPNGHAGHVFSSPGGAAFGDAACGRSAHVSGMLAGAAHSET